MPLRPKKRAASLSSHVAHGTVPGSWTGSQLVSALHSIFGVIFIFNACLDQDFIGKLRFCGVTTVLAVNIWGTGRVHIQGKGASHFAHLLLSVKDHSQHSDALPPQSPVLSESSSATGSLLPGQAGSAFSNLVVSVLGILLVSLSSWVGMFFCSILVFHGFLGSVLLGSAFSLKTYLLGTLVKRLCSHSLFWRWSRSRHKRIRGIGSQAASRRGAKSRRLALAFKARSISGPTFHSHWKMFLRFLSVRDRMPADLLCSARSRSGFFCCMGSFAPFSTLGWHWRSAGHH